MQTSLWKMTALVGVVGIGVLVVLQAQKGLSGFGQPGAATPQTVAAAQPAPESEQPPVPEFAVPQPSEPLVPEPLAPEPVAIAPEPLAPEPAVPEFAASGPASESPTAFRRQSESSLPTESVEPFDTAAHEANPFTDPPPASPTPTPATELPLPAVPVRVAEAPPAATEPTLATPFPVDPDASAFDGNGLGRTDTAPPGAEVPQSGAPFNPYESAPQPEPQLTRPPTTPPAAGTAEDADAELPGVPELSSPAEFPTPPEQPGRASVTLPTPTTEEDEEPPAIPMPEPEPELAAPALTGPGFGDSGPEVVIPSRGAEPPTPEAVIPEAGPTAPPALEPEPIDPLDNLSFPPARTAENTRPSPEEPAESVGPPELEPSGLMPQEPTTANVQPTGGRQDPPGVPVTVTPPATPPAAPPTEAPAPRDKRSTDPLTGDGVVTDSQLAEQQRPQLRIEKVAPPQAVLGQPMVYRIVVRNGGQSAAHQVVVEDQIPKGTNLTGTIPRAELLGTTLRWKLGSLEPNEEKTISVRVVPTSEGRIGSVAKVNFVAEVAARTVVTAPKLTLTLTGPGEALVGSTPTFKFTVTNTGESEATGVYIRNIVPEGLKHPGGNDLEYEVGTLAAGQSREVQLTMTAAQPGRIVNKAVATASGGVSVEATCEVDIVGTRLSLTRTGPKKRYVGRVAEFVNTVQNDSPAPLLGVKVVEQLPPGMQFIEAQPAGRFDPQTQTVVWELGQLAPQGQQDLLLRLMPQSSGSKKSQVSATDSSGGKAVVQSETLVEGFTALRLNIGEVPDPVEVGEEIALRFVTNNRGTDPATNVRVELEVPAEMQLVSAKGQGEHQQVGSKVVFAALPMVKDEAVFDVVLKAVKPGDARIGFQMQSDQLEEPLNRDEAIRVLPAR